MQDIDPKNIATCIHSIHFIIPKASIRNKTINQFSNGKKNIKFENSISKGKEYFWVKIIIPDVAKTETKTFPELSAFIKKAIRSIESQEDRELLLEKYREDDISMTYIDIFIRVFYTQDKSILEQFELLKEKSSALQILIPNLVDIDNCNKNSLYFNFKNGKKLIIYDEQEKRNLESIKAEFRINTADNLVKVFDIENNKEHLRFNELQELNIECLIQYYNIWIDKIINSINLKEKKNIEEKNTYLKQQMDFYKVSDFKQLDDKKKRKDKENKKSLKEKRERHFSISFNHILNIDNNINKWLKEKHLDIYKKIYPQFDTQKFFQKKIREYSTIHTMIDFSKREYSCFLPKDKKRKVQEREIYKEERKKHSASHHNRIPFEVLEKLTKEEYKIIFDHTIKTMTNLKGRIKKKYSVETARLKFKQTSTKTLFPDYSPFNINNKKLRKEINYIQNRDIDILRFKGETIDFLSKFKFSFDDYK